MTTLKETVGYSVWAAVQVELWRCHGGFPSSFLPLPLFLLLPNFPSNFSECSELLHADALFCFCLLNIWAAPVMVADWKDQALLVYFSLLIKEKLKGKNAIQALLSTLKDGTHISANVLLSCLTSSLPFSSPSENSSSLRISSVLHLYVGVS